MTSSSFGAVLLKVMGLYFAIEAVLGIVGIALAVTDPTGMPWVVSFAAIAYQAAYVVVMAVSSAALLMATSRVAKRLFPADGDNYGLPLDAQSALGVGIAMLGVYLVATYLASVVGFFGEFFWYLEGSRQDLVPDFWQSTWRETVPKMGTAAIGCILCLNAKTLSLFLTSSWGAEPVEVEAIDRSPADQ